jgi:hypothetical protein
MEIDDLINVGNSKINNVYVISKFSKNDLEKYNKDDNILLLSSLSREFPPLFKGTDEYKLYKKYKNLSVLKLPESKDYEFFITFVESIKQNKNIYSLYHPENTIGILSENLIDAFVEIIVENFIPNLVYIPNHSFISLIDLFNNLKSYNKSYDQNLIISKNKGQQHYIFGYKYMYYQHWGKFITVPFKEIQKKYNRVWYLTSNNLGKITPDIFFDVMKASF